MQSYQLVDIKTFKYFRPRTTLKCFLYFQRLQAFNLHLLHLTVTNRLAKLHFFYKKFAYRELN